MVSRVMTCDDGGGEVLQIMSNDPGSIISKSLLRIYEKKRMGICGGKGALKKSTSTMNYSIFERFWGPK